MKQIKFEEKEIKKIAQNFLEDIPQNIFSASVILLSGDLGAGKTTLTKAIAKKMGVKKEIVSPTFVIMKTYEVKDKRFKRLIHIDAYRLEEGKDLSVLGWEEIVSDKENLVILEWPEMVESHLPQNAFKVRLSHLDEKTRMIEF